MSQNNSQQHSQSKSASPKVFGIDSTRLFRAFVEPRGRSDLERTVFVEASHRHEASEKIARAIYAIEYRNDLDQTLRDRIYNLASAAEIIDETPGQIADLELCIFETGWCGTETYYARDPLFLVDSPAMIRKWAQIPERAP